MARSSKNPGSSSSRSAAKRTASAPAVPPAAPAPAPATRPTATVSAPTAPAPAKPQPVLTLTHDQVAKRAYEIWVAKGRPQGRDVENWQQAERELKAALGIR